MLTLQNVLSPLVAMLVIFSLEASASAIALSAEEQQLANLFTGSADQHRSGMTLDPTLTAVARARAADLCKRNYFSHVNPDGHGPDYMVRQAGYILPSWGDSTTDNNVESIGAGYSSASDMWQAWITDSAHATHVLGLDSFFASETSYGVGFYHDPNSTYQYYWVLITAPPQPASALPPKPTVNPPDNDLARSLVWENKATGEVQAWFMNGANCSAESSLTTPLNACLDWNIVGMGDFNGDGQQDMVWQNNRSGQVAVTYMNGAKFLGVALVGVVSNLSWKIVGVGDFNGDGHPDLVWQDGANGQIIVWLMNGSKVVSGSPVTPRLNASWRVAGVGDLNGDGHPDLVVQNIVNGKVSFLLMNGTSAMSAPGITQLPLSWKIAGVGKLGANQMGVVLQDSANGQLFAWLTSAGTVTAGTALNPGFIADPAWSLRNH